MGATCLMWKGRSGRQIPGAYVVLDVRMAVKAILPVPINGFAIGDCPLLVIVNVLNSHLFTP